ncbi:dienelactone hydrolase family protein [Winogradskyella alexanderae]|uniref:Dienelactone hydrolase family protein n=1 Tax=Winogradskyella alexanderae TaxID=2877123 RepID=A0ABS7XNW2_9FLAO|nr:dienelactone hydrolase family protein [Winogradskyella alexanderae]MCA0131698.1 dienelactone hydrolase family protein [Winogradskyella alexanderae]
MKQTSLFLIMVTLLFCVCCKNKINNSDASATEIQSIKIKGTEVIYATDSTNLKGYIAYDENITEKRPAVLIVHEWWGHNEYVRERADMLAELGYTAMAVDMYGDGKQAAHPDDAGKFARSVFMNLPEAKARFNAAVELLKTHESVDTDKLAAIGYCFGGSVVLTMANSGADLDAVAAFHSGVALPVMPNDQLKARVLVCNGGADPFISPESITTFTKAMDSIGAKYEYIAYPDVLHSFTSKAADENAKKFDLPLAYDGEADTKSWNSLQQMLNEVF